MGNPSTRRCDRRAVEEAGVPLERVIVEVGSATKQRTPELFKLFARARKGEVKSIWAIRQDRFQRNRKTNGLMWELIDDHGVTFRFGDQPDIDKNDPSSIFVAGVLGSAAQFETAQLSQRTKNGLMQNRLARKHHGRPPSGYLNQDGRLIPDPETWEHYRDVIQTYIQTRSSSDARRRRYELTGKPWGVSSFARWITSPNIRGAVVYGGRSEQPEVFWDMHPALMSAAEWETVQEIRKNNRQISGSHRQASGPTIGTGLLTCAACGKRLAKGFKTRKGHLYVFYKCRTALNGGCEQGHRNLIHAKDVPGHIRRAIRIAAVHIASQEVPNKLPEPAELSELKRQRDRALALNDPDLKAVIEKKQQRIDELEASQNLSSFERQEAIRDEFRRLSNPEVLTAQTDDDLRSLAIRYGLQMTSDNKFVCEYNWQRLGVTLTMSQDDASGVVATISAKPVLGMDRAALFEELRR